MGADELTSDGCRTRRARLWDALGDGCDLCVIGDPSHLIYFAGFAVSDFVFRSNDGAALLVLTRDRALLVADSMLKMFFDGVHVDEIVAPTWYDGRHPAPHRRGKLVETALETIAHKAPEASRIGIELGATPSGIVEGLRSRRSDCRFLDLDPIIRSLRRRKDPDELALIERAIRAGEAGHAEAIARITPGTTELEAFTIIQSACYRALGEQARVYGDFVASGQTEIRKGGPPTTRAIAEGDLFLLDYSVVVRGYRGDFTNTFCVGRAPTTRQVELFEACVEAIAAGESLLKPGAVAREIDAAVRQSLAARGLEGAFPSHTGHGIGLSHPEPPYLVAESAETLVEGDVVTLEPGLFIEGEGAMRYEHNYVITAEGFRRLTQHAIRIDLTS